MCTTTTDQQRAFFFLERNEREWCRFVRTWQRFLASFDPSYLLGRLSDNTCHSPSLFSLRAVSFFTSLILFIFFFFFCVCVCVVHFLSTRCDFYLWIGRLLLSPYLATLLSSKIPHRPQQKLLYVTRVVGATTSACVMSPWPIFPQFSNFGFFILKIILFLLVRTLKTSPPLNNLTSLSGIEREKRGRDFF